MALGLEGEQVAYEFLKKQGYKILQRNYRPGNTEIDIIGYDKGTIAFLEVKTGLSRRYGPPEIRVTETKKRRIYKTAQEYIERAVERLVILGVGAEREALENMAGFVVERHM